MWHASKIVLIALVIVGVGTTLLGGNSPLPAAADTDIRSKICDELDAPVILEPATDFETDADSVTVSGTAVAGQVVTVMRNGQGAGAATTGLDGTFMLLVPLVAGPNAIQAQVTNDCDTVRSSATVTVTRNVPEAPTEPQQPTEPATQTPITGLTPVTGRSKPGGQGGTQQTPEHKPLTRPRITYPTNGLEVAEGQVRVTGTADPGSVVLVFVNSEVVAQVSVSETGNWATYVGLAPGQNTIQAQASRDGQTAVSEQVSVDYTRRGVSRLIDRPYSITVQVISLVLVALVIGAGLFIAHRHHRLRAWFSRKKKSS